MSQSLVKNYMHLVFSTKYRERLIHRPLEEELHAYLADECKRLECAPIKIGGFTDHVHILCMLSKKIALMKLLEVIKSHSSSWMKTKEEDLAQFYWQDARLNDEVGQGYGAFSVNPAEIDRVIAYIANQKEHHKTITFQDGYRAILKRYKVEYDERFVWD